MKAIRSVSRVQVFEKSAGWFEKTKRLPMRLNAFRIAIATHGETCADHVAISEILRIETSATVT